MNVIEWILFIFGYVCIAGLCTLFLILRSKINNILTELETQAAFNKALVSVLEPQELIAKIDRLNTEIIEHMQRHSYVNSGATDPAQRIGPDLTNH